MKKISRVGRIEIRYMRSCGGEATEKEKKQWTSLRGEVQHSGNVQCRTKDSTYERRFGGCRDADTHTTWF